MGRPTAVLLDAGGVFVLPDHARVLGVCTRSDPPIETTGLDAARLDGAHYVGAARFTTELDAEADWGACWSAYLEGFVEHLLGPAATDASSELHRHLDSEFADAAMWSRVAPGCTAGLDALAETGVRLGVVSNADGMMAQRLRQLEILQVGPGIGVQVECVIDSGAVGVMKPDPRIFRLALDAMDIAADDAWYVGDMPGIDVVGARRAGLRPFLVDPLELHHGADYDRIASLGELAAVLDGPRR